VKDIITKVAFVHQLIGDSADGATAAIDVLNAGASETTTTARLALTLLNRRNCSTYIFKSTACVDRGSVCMQCGVVEHSTLLIYFIHSNNHSKCYLMCAVS
jgi:hypothetical protein